MHTNQRSGGSILRYSSPPASTTTWPQQFINHQSVITNKHTQPKQTSAGYTCFRKGANWHFARDNCHEHSKVTSLWPLANYAVRIRSVITDKRDNYASLRLSRCVITQKSEFLSYFAAKAWNRANTKCLARTLLADCLCEAKRCNSAQTTVIIRCKRAIGHANHLKLLILRGWSPQVLPEDPSPEPGPSWSPR